MAKPTKVSKAARSKRPGGKRPRAGSAGGGASAVRPSDLPLGLDLSSALTRPLAGDGKQSLRGEAVLIGGKAAGKPGSAWSKELPGLPDWLVERALRRRGEPQLWARAEGPLWVLVPLAPRGSSSGDASLSSLDGSVYGAARDIVGLMLVGAFPEYQLRELRLRFVAAEPEEVRGALVGLELGLYRYKALRSMTGAPPQIIVDEVDPDEVTAAARLGCAVNIARHLVNLPPAELNPATFAVAATAMFEGSATTTVEVWQGERLARERLHLLAAVGAGALETARLVHIRYRPGQGRQARLTRPLAFVGKGVTFDSGGLDIKDAASMRLMKKDMGGAASVLGLAYWVDRSGLDIPCDFYLALAENAISERAFHPGDVIASRAGHTVEIDNTDAEGRLVLADAFDVAVKASGKDAPVALIDFATLTGAMRVALGTRIAGYFANHDRLAEAVARAGQAAGEPTWRMPLFQDYWPLLRSSVADFSNSAASRFGGAITAALFLQRFAGNIPWLHFDLYCWGDGPQGGCAEPGGNGQGVQLMARLLECLPRDFFGA